MHPSQGYLCCKRRVLEFDEFLKIEGCKQGRHVFVPKKSEDEKVHMSVIHLVVTLIISVILRPLKSPLTAG